jgi:hypothetical protein
VRHLAELALSDSERSLLSQLHDEPSGVGERIARTGLIAAQVLTMLSLLDVKRLARRLPSHRFVRARLLSPDHKLLRGGVLWRRSFDSGHGGQDERSPGSFGTPTGSQRATHHDGDLGWAHC